MKNTLIILLVLLIVVIIHTTGRIKEGFDYEMDALRDSLIHYKQVEHSLTGKIDSVDCELVASKDSIRFYRYMLKQTKLKYEALLGNMYSWSDDEHVQFFTTQTDQD